MNPKELNMGETKQKVIKEAILPKKLLPELFEKLLPDYDIYGPVQKAKNDAYDIAPSVDKKAMDVRKKLRGNEFEKVETADILNLEYTSTVTPLKKFFIPPKEDIVKFELENLKLKSLEDLKPDVKPFILFGVHACDMQGLLRLDYSFIKGNPESNYLSRREKSIIVGINCIPDEYCFCEAVGAQIYDEGFDVFLTNIGQSFHVTVYTEKGLEIISKVELYDVDNTSIKEKEKALERSRSLEGSEKFKPDYHNMPLLSKSGDDLPFWDRIGERCFSCGTCNLVCPTCYCFDVNDVMNINIKDGTRRRFWDSCQLESFAVVAGGENFRASRTNRNKHRFYRKFRYLMEEYGKPFCVGCGRCGRQCVADINMIETSNLLYENVEKI